MATIKVSETLTVDVVTAHNPHVAIDRKEGGLVRVEPVELRPLMAALCTAAGLLVARDDKRADELSTATRNLSP